MISSPSLHALSGKLTGEKEILFEAKNGQSSIAFEGSLMVPENRSKKDSRMIPLKYVRFPATGKNISPPIVYLSRQNIGVFHCLCRCENLVM